MDETSPNEKPAKDFNKIDLGQLQGFSFGTQWTEDKSSSGPSRPEGGRGPRREDRPRREDGGAGAPGGGPRDRRGFRKPAGGAPRGDESSAGAGAAGGAGAGGGGEAPTFSRPRREGGDAPRGPRREGQGRGEFRGGGRFGGPREGGAPAREQGPYVSPFYDVTFYPEDTGFSALAKAIRTSCRTYELFEIARVVIGKNDRFVAVIQHKKPESGAAEPAPRAKPAPFAIAVPDGTPFENESAAIAYVLEKHLGQFFDAAEVEVEAPKGNFQVVNKCTITGELLGPPNYHRYNQIVQQHHAARIKLPLEVYRGKIESVRDPEAIAQWLEKVKKATRYTWKTATAATTEKAPTSEAAPVAESATAAAEGEAIAPAEAPASAEAPTSAPETASTAPAAPSFDSVEEARDYLLAHAKDKVVRTVETLRFHGKNLESLPQGELRRALEGALERQRRFPLDTANALRGRLRREGFTIFKKGSKGISYVCAVKRKFRVPGQVFSDSIGALITFIESNPMVKVSALPEKFLGVAPAAKPDEASTSGEAAVVAAAPAPTAEQQARLNRLGGDLRWLISEGYVTEFIDGCLFAAAPVVEARKKEIEGAEHDPENFPEAPKAEAPKVEEPKADEQPGTET